MRPRIAVPLPHSFDPEYAERALPQYERAIEVAGGEAVRIGLDLSREELRKRIESCDGVLLPGSKADVDPAQYGAARSPHTAESDARRNAVDHALLEDAHRLRKPVLGICYGLQILNVERGGSLVQHIPEFLPRELSSKVNHEAGRTVALAHEVEVEAGSMLASILRAGHAQRPGEESKNGGGLVIAVNSSHHQSAQAIGDGLRVVARCTADGIIEALEGNPAEQFVLAVQWHPERSVEDDANSRAIFTAFIRAAAARRAQGTR